MATATLPMLYSQIADRFGRRPHAKLVVTTTEPSVVASNALTQAARSLDIFITNEGRGLARFPALRFLKESGFYNDAGPYHSKVPRWALFDDQTEWLSFRGSASDVVHPGEKITVGSLAQRGKIVGDPTKNRLGHLEPSKHLFFRAVTLQTSVICDGMPEFSQSFHWPEFDYDPK